MARGTALQRSDVSKVARRGVVTLVYRGQVRKREARMRGQDDDTFFVIDSRVIPLPDDIEELAQEVGVTLADSPTERSFRELVADAIVAEAIEKAPEHLRAIIGVDFYWPSSTLVTLERSTKEKEARVASLIREVTARLRSKRPQSLPVFDWSPPASTEGVSVAAARAPAAVVARPLVDPEPEPELAVASSPESAPAVSDAVMQKVRAAIRAARHQDVPQRLPAGARKSIEASAPGALVWANNKINVCRSLEDAIGGARAVSTRGVDSAVIDWDGEQPVLVRRFTAGGVTAYRCEDSIKIDRSKSDGDLPGDVSGEAS